MKDTGQVFRTKHAKCGKKIRARPGGAARKSNAKIWREQIIAEFGQHVRRDAWAPQRWALKQKVGAAPKAVLMALVHHVDEFGYAMPSARKLGEEVGIDRTNVWRHLRTLEDAGLVARIAWLSTKNGAVVANGYIVPFWQDPDAVSQSKKPPAGSPVGLDAVLQRDERGRRSKATPSAQPHQAPGAEPHLPPVRDRTTVNSQQNSHPKNRPISSSPSGSQVLDPQCEIAPGGEEVHGLPPQVDEKKKVGRKEDEAPNDSNDQETPSARSHRGCPEDHERDGLDDDTESATDKQIVATDFGPNPYLKNADKKQTAIS